MQCDHKGHLSTTLSADKKYTFCISKTSQELRMLSSAQCVHCTVFFPFDRVRWDTLSNLVTFVLLNIYLSQRARSKGTLRKLDFRESQTLKL